MSRESDSPPRSESKCHISVRRFERNLTQTLRQQQDEAYEVSLRADQEKERLRLAEQERLRLEQQAVEDERQAELDRKAVCSEVSIQI